MSDKSGADGTAEPLAEAASSGSDGGSSSSGGGGGGGGGGSAGSSGITTTSAAEALTSPRVLRYLRAQYLRRKTA